MRDKILQMLKNNPSAEEDLIKFEKAKQAYIENPIIDNSIKLKSAYVDIYEDIKVHDAIKTLIWHKR